MQQVEKMLMKKKCRRKCLALQILKYVEECRIDVENVERNVERTLNVENVEENVERTLNVENVEDNVERAEATRSRKGSEETCEES